MPTLRFARVESTLGWLWLAETDAGVATVSRSEPFDALRRRFAAASIEPADLDGSWIEAALSGGSLPPVDLGGLSAFDARVYERVREIPPGETLTYGDVAALVGSPGAARAVGNAMARCPLFPAVPCHRVVRASDGWSGWGSDPAVKRRLLAAERR
jgi:AraC family transcriptional regulator, regulatory protein of adaptative response / methylated-DNA-[protein]-cysteine methyltransferase